MTLLAEQCESMSVAKRRLLVVGSIPFLAMAFWALIVWPAMAAYRAQVSWRQETASTLAQAHGSKDDVDMQTQQLASLPAAPLWNKFYKVSKAGTGGPMLQTDVSSMLNLLQISVQSLTPLRTAEVNGLNSIGLRVTASMSVDQLKKLFVKIGDNARYLYVDRLRINAPPSQLPDQNATLTVVIEIYGVEYVLNASPTPSRSEAPTPGAVS